MWRSCSFPIALAVHLIAAAQPAARRDSIAPGIALLRYETSAPQVIHVLAVDRREAGRALVAYRPNGLVRTSAQARENDRDGRTVVAAVNADFFSYETRRPMGNQVSNGVMVAGTKSPRSHLGITGSVTPYIEVLSFKGTAGWNGSVLRIDGVNQKRGGRKNVLYNSYWGRELNPDSGDVMINLRLIDRWSVADTVRAVVEKQRDLTILEDSLEAVLLAAGDAVRAGPDEGDTVKLYLAFEGDRRPYTQVLGGGGRILENGRIVGDGIRDREGIKSKFLTDRHPRTFVGFDRDTATIFLGVVDGRQGASVGMNFKELGEFLLRIGAWNALNLDGGGSSAMVVRHKVVNSPSDAGGERPVANTLQILEYKQEKGSHEN